MIVIYFVTVIYCCCCFSLFVAICTPQPVPPNETVTYTTQPNQLDGGYPLDTVATYSCNEGYSPSGRTRSYCRMQGWSDPPPACTGNRNNAKLQS